MLFLITLLFLLIHTKTNWFSFYQKKLYLSRHLVYNLGKGGGFISNKGEKGFGFIGLLITLAIIGYLIYMAIDYYSREIESTAQTAQMIQENTQGNSNKPSGKKSRPKSTVVKNMRAQINALRNRHLNNMKRAMQ